MVSTLLTQSSAMAALRLRRVDVSAFGGSAYGRQRRWASFFYSGVFRGCLGRLPPEFFLEESMLHLVLLLPGGMQIFVKTLTGKTATLALWGAYSRCGSSSEVFDREAGKAPRKSSIKTQMASDPMSLGHKSTTEGRQPHARPTLWLRPRPRIRCVSFAGDDPNSLPNEVMIKNWTKAWRSFRWETGCRPPRGHVGNVLRVTLLARTRTSTRVAPAAAAELGPREPESAALLASSGVRWPDVLFTCRRTAALIDLRSLLADRREVKLVLIYSPHGLMPLPTDRPTATLTGTEPRATLPVGSQWKRAVSSGMRAATKPRSASLSGGPSWPRHARAALLVFVVLALFVDAAAVSPMEATVPGGACRPDRDSNLTQASGGRTSWWRDEQIRQRAARQASWTPSSLRESPPRLRRLCEHGRLARAADRSPPGFRQRWLRQVVVPEHRKRTRKRGIMRQQRIDRDQQAEDAGQGVMSIATWNVQAMPVQGHDLSKLESLVEIAKRRRWQAVLVADLHSDAASVMDLNSWILVHSRRTGVLLSPPLARQWRQEGSRSHHAPLGSRVFVGHFCLYAVYAPHSGLPAERESFLDTLAVDIRQVPASSKLVLGGDFNADLGANAGMPDEGVLDVAGERVRGPFGIGRGTAAGPRLEAWAQELGLCFWATFFRQRRRGTWQHHRTHAWYELDFFLGRVAERSTMVKNVRTISEELRTDHLPKVARIQWTDNAPQHRHHTPTRLAVELMQGKSEEALALQAQFTVMTQERMEQEAPTDWKGISDMLVQTAESIVGREPPFSSRPWLRGHAEERRQKNRELRASWRRMRAAPPEEAVWRRIQHRELRRDLKHTERRWEKEWYSALLEENRRAAERNDSWATWHLLKRLGLRKAKRNKRREFFTAEEFRDHLASIQADECPADAASMERVPVGGNPEEAAAMDEEPDDAEIDAAMKGVKCTAADGDQVRMEYIRCASASTWEAVRNEVRRLWNLPLEEWHQEVQVLSGVTVALYKKKEWSAQLAQNKNNYRGVTLLSYLSRIHGRLVMKRLYRWAEAAPTLSEHQWGFRRGRSTEDVIMVMRRIHEQAAEVRRTDRAPGSTMDDDYTATLLDLVKAYPRTSRTTLWNILQKRGLGPVMIRNLKAMHDLTGYQVRLCAELSSRYVPKRGVREGCATSTVAFNCVHDEAMRQAREDRAAASQEPGASVGIPWAWKPDLRLRAPEHEKRRAKGIHLTHFTDLEFADDTTLLGRRKELQERGNAAVVACLGRFGENENEDKRESITFGDPASGKVRVLGAYLDNGVDMKQRLSRAASVWAVTRGRLQGSLLPIRDQVQIVKATVQSTLLYSSKSRPFTSKDFGRMQSFMDRCWRYLAHTNLWTMRRNKTPMQAVRERLGVHRLRHEVERMAWDWYGHILRMHPKSAPRVALHGWIPREGKEAHGTGRLTYARYLAGLVERVAQLDAEVSENTVHRIVADRQRWRELGHRLQEHGQQADQTGDRLPAPGARRARQPDTEHVCTECSKRCKSARGLVFHCNHSHRGALPWPCRRDGCTASFTSSQSRGNHEATCRGSAAATQAAYRASRNQQAQLARGGAGNHPCPHCDFRARSASGLTTHLRAKHPPAAVGAAPVAPQQSHLRTKADLGALGPHRQERADGVLKYFCRICDGVSSTKPGSLVRHELNCDGRVMTTKEREAERKRLVRAGVQQ